ncbi:cyclic nucleotide-binding domain-containing protein [Rhodophyticola sp. MJ-SS7]|uniref:cyclic nucleotide-binding domain-containing protein n=1 Tax=Ovoidimarina sediminis TaxID=3079856 RepID=UPI00290F4202|nr:cyclic nucleotide-binding domain-containing protein [Rhodophyticola sp. MJ-SS7]MDU8944722.1 cyclic nucleotide-binding domain-containing protein [Rhodophyticola sp. MJ-SS7]
MNDAIAGANQVREFFGYRFDEITFLAALCIVFLLAVTILGLLKMRVNTMKGVLAERMLRRFRYQLITRILRFPQPYFERVSQGEVVSMVTAESEPLGGLMGDAISQPVLQLGQMLTILTFLFFQSFWFGLTAIALIPVQAIIIPRLQKQINLLNKKRIQEVRILAAQIGEGAAGASTLRTNGGWRFRQALFSRQLGRLFLIRFEIYKKKFFMKFLNNFITQLTPFFYYLVGGILVLGGQVTLGALVAALAAYKDLSDPWKELLTFYNTTQDMSLRWNVITERFAPQGMLNEKLLEGEPEENPRLHGDVTLNDLTIRDGDGNVILDGVTAHIPGRGITGIQAPNEEDRRALAGVLTREILPSSGEVTISGHKLSSLHQSIIASRIGLASSRPIMFQGTFGDNVMMPMLTRPHGDTPDDAFYTETLKSGNSPDPADAVWLDPSAAGLHTPEELREWGLKLIRDIGAGTTLFRRVIEQKFSAADHHELAERLVSLRPKIREAIDKVGLAKHVHRFDPDRYNPAMPVAENLLFSTPTRPINQEIIAEQETFLSALRDLGIDKTLIDLTRDVLEMLRGIFGHDGTDHPLFQKLGLETKTYEAALKLIDRYGEDATQTLADGELATLLSVPFATSAEQIGPSFSDDLKARILDLRRTHSGQLRETMADLFAPIDPAAFAPGLSVLENALFGKISGNAGARADEIKRLIADILVAEGAEPLVTNLVYDFPVTLGGQNLPAAFVEPLSLTRATIKKPDLLILDRALSSYDDRTRAKLYLSLRKTLTDTTVIYIDEKIEQPDAFDHFIEIRDGRLLTRDAPEEVKEDRAASADIVRKTRALQQSMLFSGLSQKQLRLLAFGSKWYHAEAGDVVFYQGDDPTDGAFMLTEGEAGVYSRTKEGQDELLVKVGPGTLIGELGVIRNVPRTKSLFAETDITCLRIGKEELLAVIENDAATAFKLLQVVAGYLPD